MFEQEEKPNELQLFDDYAAWTDIVAQYPPTAEAYYLALGIADEMGEFSACAQDECLAEAGDVMWYCARYATKVLGVPFSDVVKDSALTSPRFAMANVGIICGYEKKKIRDGDTWSPEKHAQKAATTYTALCAIVAWVANGPFRGPINLAEAVSSNRLKLSKRLDADTIRGDGDHR